MFYSAVHSQVYEVINNIFSEFSGVLFMLQRIMIL